MHLDQKQLEGLTGYVQPKKQVEWLRKELSIDPPIGADGRARVSQAVIDKATLARRTGGTDAASGNSHQSTGPKWTVAA